MSSANEGRTATASDPNRSIPEIAAEFDGLLLGYGFNDEAPNSDEVRLQLRRFTEWAWRIGLRESNDLSSKFKEPALAKDDADLMHYILLNIERRLHELVGIGPCSQQRALESHEETIARHNELVQKIIRGFYRLQYCFLQDMRPSLQADERDNRGFVRLPTFKEPADKAKSQAPEMEIDRDDEETERAYVRAFVARHAEAKTRKGFTVARDNARERRDHKLKYRLNGNPPSSGSTADLPLRLRKEGANGQTSKYTTEGAGALDSAFDLALRPAMEEDQD